MRICLRNSSLRRLPLLTCHKYANSLFLSFSATHLLIQTYLINISHCLCTYWLCSTTPCCLVFTLTISAGQLHMSPYQSSIFKLYLCQCLRTCTSSFFLIFLHFLIKDAENLYIFIYHLVSFAPSQDFSSKMSLFVFVGDILSSWFSQEHGNLNDDA